jgi:hypothetical protein
MLSGGLGAERVGTVEWDLREAVPTPDTPLPDLPPTAAIKRGAVIML